MDQGHVWNSHWVASAAHVIPATAPRLKYRIAPHLTDAETEAQRSQVPCAQAHAASAGGFQSRDGRRQGQRSGPLRALTALVWGQSGPPRLRGQPEPAGAHLCAGGAADIPATPRRPRAGRVLPASRPPAPRPPSAPRAYLAPGLARWRRRPGSRRRGAARARAPASGCAPRPGRASRRRASRGCVRGAARRRAEPRATGSAGGEGRGGEGRGGAGAGAGPPREAGLSAGRGRRGAPP